MNTSMQPQSRNHAITDNSDNPDNKGASAVSEQTAKAEDIRCEKIKSPAKFAPGIPPMSGESNAPRREIIPRRRQIDRMAQALTNPPGAEDWRQGLEWLDIAAHMERINFDSEQLADVHKPSVRAMAASITDDGENALPETLVDCYLSQMGAPNRGIPQTPARTASASDARQFRNHAITAIIPTTLTTREQAP